MILTAIIVDDEPLARDLISSILSDIEGVNLVAICASGQEAVEAVLAHTPDILFLDIEMPGMNGFDVVKAIQSDILPKIIFTTAYSEYAIEAFSVNALNYVLKPVHEAAVIESLDRARQTLPADRASVNAKTTMLSVLHPDGREKSVALIEPNKVTFSKPDDIIWLEAAGDYVCVHLHTGVKIIRRTLNSFMTDLPEEKFLRIHRSTIVNIMHVNEMISQKKGEAILVMSDNHSLKVSRTYGTQIRAQLKNTL